MLNLIACVILQQNPVSVVNDGQHVVVDNGSIKLTIDKKSGKYDLTWQKSAIRQAYGEAGLATEPLCRTADYAQHEVAKSDVRRIKDKFGRGVRVVLHHRTPGKPELQQTFWIYTDRPEATIQIAATASPTVSARFLTPLATVNPLQVPHRSPLQALFVPWDNDNYFRYRSDGWGEGDGDGDGSYEVSAVYDGGSREGLIVGSIDHDLWKSAVRFKRNANGEVGELHAKAGITSKYTHDQEPHGAVTGTEVKSPRMVIGWYGDWRKGMERYGDLNAIVKPPLPWSGTIPFGWNSWSGHKSKVQATDAKAATDFLVEKLPDLRSGKTAYVNLDSFWDNLSKEQRAEFVKHAHAAGLKAGIYWTPFVCWGRLTDHVNGREDPLTYNDLVLRDAKGQPLPKLDGGYPLDPSHPGTLARIDRQLGEFVAAGYDFVKLDFMSHGALEAQHHDPSVMTGVAAYSLGMQRIVDDLSPKKVGRPFFISLSIAPLFPHGYAHTRRISCDVFANIGASEYLLNSSTYGWWTNHRLYAFNDPDSASVYQPKDEQPVTEAESRTRVTASVISGGMMFLGDDMTKPEACARVESVFKNKEILALARKAPAFLPVEGTSETKAGTTFVWPDPNGKDVYVAAFNYDKNAKSAVRIAVSRLGLREGDWTMHDLWSGLNGKVGTSLSFGLDPMACTLVRLSIK